MSASIDKKTLVLGFRVFLSCVFLIAVYWAQYFLTHGHDLLGIKWVAIALSAPCLFYFADRMPLFSGTHQSFLSLRFNSAIFFALFLPMTLMICVGTSWLRSHSFPKIQSEKGKLKSSCTLFSWIRIINCLRLGIQPPCMI